MLPGRETLGAAFRAGEAKFADRDIGNPVPNQSVTDARIRNEAG